MSHFYADIRGNKGEATRCGTKNSGIQANIRGWNTGVKIYLYHENGKDRIEVYRTHGRNARMSHPYTEPIATIIEGD